MTAGTQETDRIYETVETAFKSALKGRCRMQLFDYRNGSPYGRIPQQMALVVLAPVDLSKDYKDARQRAPQGEGIAPEYRNRPHPMEQICHDLQRAYLIVGGLTTVKTFVGIRSALVVFGHRRGT